MSCGWTRGREALPRTSTRGGFGSPSLPIAEVVARGRFDQRHSFAISRRAPGVTHDTLPLADRLAVLPSVFEALDAVHATDISATTGYGRAAKHHYRSTGAEVASYDERLRL